jgi:hypothetical protein
MRKKIKHISLKSLRNKAWKLQSEYIRRYERGICFTCGVTKDWKEMDTGHYIHGNWMDFILMALHCQCTRCNRFLHGNLGVYAERMVAEYGEKAVAELRAYSEKKENKDKKYNIFELQELINTYKQRLAELGAK